MIIFRFQHGGPTIVNIISEHHSGPTHKRIHTRIVFHIKPQFIRFHQNVFGNLPVSVQMVIYLGKQPHIVRILHSYKGTGFLATFTLDFLHSEYIADLFHQPDPAGQRQMSGIALSYCLSQTLYSIFYHFTP